MTASRPAAVVSALAALAATAGWAAAAAGQGAEGERACRLVLEPTTDSTESVSVEVAPDTYVTHVRGGLRWTCGNARMLADSAVRYENEGRLEMIGSADYRDSVRTLLADTVTYFEGEDRIVARGDVRLTRRATGSTLTGPEVRFHGVSRGELRRTVATGRPVMRIRRDTAAPDTARPVRVEGDRIVLLGEDEAHVRGDVEIRRPPGVEARSDSAVFHLDEETGELHGSPEVTGRSWRLTGRTIRTRFHDGELREVVAEGDARGRGEDFDLFASRIRARMAGREIERIWALGEGRPVAYSPPYRLSADSLEFRFRGGDLDEVRAVRRANAVEVGGQIPDEPRADVALGAGERSWVSADSIFLAFAGTGGRADSAPPRPAGPVRGGAADAGVPPPPAAADSTPVGGLVPVDSLVDVTGPPAGAAARPRAGADAARGASGAGDAGGGPGARGDGDGDGREIRTMRAVGDARAYYLLEPDEPGGRPPKHYQRGREIVVHFEGGEAVRLEGREAVGVHLDPSDERAGEAGDGAPGAADTVPPDTAAAPVADTVPAPPDSAGSPRPDSAAAPARDSAAAPRPDSTPVTPPDSTPTARAASTGEEGPR